LKTAHRAGDERQNEQPHRRVTFEETMSDRVMRKAMGCSPTTAEVEMGTLGSLQFSPITAFLSEQSHSRCSSCRHPAE
jgi:hypothetical protein